MPLHQAIEIMLCGLNELTIICYTIPVCWIRPELLLCAADDDATIGARDQVVILIGFIPEAHRIDESWRRLVCWRCDTATDSAHGDNLVGELRGYARGVGIRSKDDLFGFDGAAGAGHRPPAL